MNLQDKTLNCSDCGKDFTFSAEEQEQFHSRGYHHDPKRCQECRRIRKAGQSDPGGNNYQTSHGERSFGFSTTRQTFPAVCAGCGKSTTVPFRPRPDRQVYCQDCYRKNSRR